MLGCADCGPNPRRNVNRVLFSYGLPSINGTTVTAEQEFSAANKVAAVSIALRHCWHARLVLIWHLGLLKLLPFFRIRGSRVALFLHGVEAWQPLDPVTRLLLKRVDFFLTNTDFTWEHFRDFHQVEPNARRQTVHLGIGSPAVAPPPRPDNVPIALMVGRLSRSEDYKGHREIIAAFSRVRRMSPNAELWIVGDGDLRPDLERLAQRSEVGTAVRFWGQVSDEQKSQLIAQSRCLALPSRGEGFGLVYLEAMRLGRPCLVSTVDAGREVVVSSNAGLAANPADQTQLESALVRLLTMSPEWDVWSRNARERFDSYFTARHFQDRLIATLQPLLNEVRSGAGRSRS